VRKLKHLQQAVAVTVADLIRDERGSAFRDGPGFYRGTVNGFQFLSESHSATDARYSGRVSVPVLWDNETRQIVNDSEDDIY
jgi:putative glutathione S-transferase